MAIDRQTAITVGQEIDLAVEEVLARFGLKRQPHRVQYGSTMTYKVEITRPHVNDKGVDEGSPVAQEWLLLGNYEIRKQFGYDGEPPFTAKDALGAEFYYNGRRFRLDGMNSRARKYPLVATALDDGRQFKFTHHVLAKLEGVGK